MSNITLSSDFSEVIIYMDECRARVEQSDTSNSMYIKVVDKKKWKTIHNWAKHWEADEEETRTRSKVCVIYSCAEGSEVFSWAFIIWTSAAAIITLYISEVAGFWSK